MDEYENYEGENNKELLYETEFRPLVDKLYKIVLYYKELYPILTNYEYKHLYLFLEKRIKFTYL